MIGHHISEHARQKILKEIAIRAQKQVLDMTYNWYDVLAKWPSNNLLTHRLQETADSRSSRDSHPH